MKVSIKLNNETEFTVTIPDNSTVDDLKIASRVACPIQFTQSISTPSLKLWYSGKLLELSKELSYYGINPGSQSTIYLTTGTNTVAQDGNSEQQQTNTTQQTTIDNNTTMDSAIHDEADDVINPNPANLISTSTEQQQKKQRRKSSGKKSNKCTLTGCNSTYLRLVGDCSYCQGKFCAKHRLLENHNCSSLKNCKDLYHERNALKLQSEQTIASKV